MRKIKYRAWDSTENLMYSWEKLDEYDTDGVLCLVDILNGKIKGVIPLEYTGLKDKNGKEIYEGDIVKSDYYHFNRITVEWNTEHWHPFSYQYGARHFEIIGNIYENPELCE